MEKGRIEEEDVEERTIMKHATASMSPPFIFLNYQEKKSLLLCFISSFVEQLLMSGRRWRDSPGETGIKIINLQELFSLKNSSLLQ